jgi:four helix bundle protein
VKVKVRVKVNTTMASNDNLMKFGAYRKSLELFDLVVTDLTPLTSHHELARLVGQQFASSDSISSNIEEGYGRGSRRDYSHFLIISRGSAQETAGRYRRFKHWLPEPVIDARVRLCSEIIAILTSSINTLRGEK